MVTPVFTLKNRVSLTPFHSGTRFGEIVTGAGQERYQGDYGPYDHIAGGPPPSRLQGSGPFAKGAHLPRGEPRCRLPFR
jgi:hypothetical protein